MRLLLCLLPALAILTGCGPQPVSPPSTTAPKYEEKAPAESKPAASAAKVELQVKDFDGVMGLVKSHKGKIVVMDAWSTSCPPCLKEFPGLVALHKKYGPEKVACISLSLDYPGIGKPADVQDPVLEFLRSQNATFDNVLASEADDVMYKKFMLPSIPAVFVYNQQGELAKVFDNRDPKIPPFNYEHVAAFVESLAK